MQLKSELLFLEETCEHLVCAVLVTAGLKDKSAPNIKPGILGVFRLFCF